MLADDGHFGDAPPGRADDGARQYTVGFSNSTLMRGIVKALTNQGFISQALAEGGGPGALAGLSDRHRRRRAALRPAASAATSSLLDITMRSGLDSRSTARSMKARTREGWSTRLP